VEQKGDLALIGDRAFPASIIRPRAALVKKVEQLGFAQAMEQAAYSWFNRLCALRYMEIKGYLDHGRRVLSAANGSAGMPQILEDCLDIELEGLDKARITEFKLDGNKDEELYRELLLTQCHALHQAMPFLFEAVDDALELLLPDNLTKTDSLIRELVAAIPEEDWRNVEIIGWLYQFYISEKKDQVIGKVVKSEDIPAATQLFTPNWIVQYLVQNSLGRQWLQTYPDSPLKDKMPYYVAPGEQQAEVQAQLAASTPESIDPQYIKVLDPACGSGHILVEAYKLLKEIYTERGFRSRDIPQLILENNLFGLDIDDRAGQLAGFALMMLAREDDRRIFSRELKLNVVALQESRHLDLADLWQALNLTSDWQRGQSQGLFESEQSNLAAAQADNRYQLLRSTVQRFTQAKTFGSLIEVPTEDAASLAELLAQLREMTSAGDSMQKPAAKVLLPYVQEAWILAQRYDAVIANPPYMGNKGMNTDLKDFAKKAYPNSKLDLFAIFMEHAFALLKPNGFNAQINMHSWMFLSSYEQLREWLIKNKTFITMAHLGSRAFEQISGEVVQTTAWVIQNQPCSIYKPVFFRLTEVDGKNKSASLLNGLYRFSSISQDKFKTIPGSPIAYWPDARVLKCWQGTLLKDIAHIKAGLSTGNEKKFQRHWFEIDISEICLNTQGALIEEYKKYSWIPVSSGGEFRKWYGNTYQVVRSKNDFHDIKTLKNNDYRLRDPIFYFREGVNWPMISSGAFGAKISPNNIVMGHGVRSAFPLKNSDHTSSTLVGYLCSKTVQHFLKILNPTLNFNNDNIEVLPAPPNSLSDEFKKRCERAIEVSKNDWDSLETSWEFKKPSIISGKHKTIQEDFIALNKELKELTIELKGIEEKNNLEISNLFNISDIIDSTINISEVTINANPSFKNSTTESPPSQESKQQSSIICELISFSIGCMLGRYSIDHEGVIFANSANKGLSALVANGYYNSFPVDLDGVLPLTDQEWFADDATNRFREFIRVAWGEEHLLENLGFVAESLCLHAIKPKRGESALDTIRRYLSTQFFKDHLRTYKKRPIYWLFSSGKYKAFECLVYLHRYNEGTLARMRTEYVIPLSAKLSSYAAKLEKDIEASNSTAEKKALEKQLSTLHNQQAELATFDEKLRHHADQRISLDLDDGVKVNYGKFGDLLAEVKAVTGGKEDS